jgi:hypothetical protein
MQKRKRTKHTTAKRLVSTRGKAGALRALTELARHARGVAHLGREIQALATRIEDLIDRLATSVGGTVGGVYAPLFEETRKRRRG